MRHLFRTAPKTDIRNVLREVDAYSTVSGGGLAAAVHVSSLYDLRMSAPSARYSLKTALTQDKERLLKNLRRSYHHSVARAIFNPKAFGVTDRGGFLEEDFDNYLLGCESRRRSLTLGDLFIPAKEPNRMPVTPLWIANATIYENGSIFPFHPSGLQKYRIVSCTHRLEKTPVHPDFYSLPLSTGMKASASFPTLLPATTLECLFDGETRYLHLFEGGLCDNLGIHTALYILAKTRPQRKVLFVIDAYKGNPEPFSESKGSPKTLQIGLRTTSISLDAWHIRHRKTVKQLVDGVGHSGAKIDVIYFGFDDLPEKTRAQVRDIGTDFKITIREQQALFEATKEVVAIKEKEKGIRELIFDQSTRSSSN